MSDQLEWFAAFSGFQQYIPRQIKRAITWSVSWWISMGNFHGDLTK
jgi:hypothetical protein